MTEQAAYSYRAARRDGTVELGAVDATSREAAAAALAQRGLWVLEVRSAAGTTGRRRLPSRDLAVGLRLLASLLDAGLPVGRALAAFAEIAPERWQVALPAIRASVREGQSLGAALAAAPLDVPSVVLGLVRAGESGSGLGAAVRRAAELMEATAATRAAIRAALAYPLILTLAGGASLALLVGIVLPRFAVMLAGLGLTLPASTRAVLVGAALARAATVPGLIALALGVLAWRTWTARPAGRQRWHEWLLHTPLIGAVRRSTAASRAGSAIAALLGSGVPVAPALLAGARASGDAAIEARLLATRQAVVAGARVSRALAEHDAATPTMIRFVSAGEESGQLGAMLDRAAAMEAERAEQFVRTAVRVLEPTLILAFGGIVAFVAAALLQAIYAVRPAG